jgi:hypothetical protein
MSAPRFQCPCGRAKIIAGSRNDSFFCPRAIAWLILVCGKTWFRGVVARLIVCSMRLTIVIGVIVVIVCVRLLRRIFGSIVFVVVRHVRKIVK